MTFVLTMELAAPGTLEETVALVAIEQRDERRKRVAVVSGYFLVPEEIEKWAKGVVERMGSVMTEPLPF